MAGSVTLGIVGCGWAASEIVRAVEGMTNLTIAAVCDSDAGRAHALASKAAADVVPDIEGLINNPRVTTVYVGLPHYLLAPTVERALRAGKHVLAEKPLALDAAEARRLGELADSRGLKLSVFFELRRAASVERARQLINQGALGDIRMVRIRTIIDKRMDYWGPRGTPNWRAKKEQAGGGVVLMNTIHQLDTLRYVTGLEFVRVSGDIATMIAPAEVEDMGTASMRLSNGAICNLVASAHSPGAVGEETIEIDGTAGRLQMPSPYGNDPVRVYSIEDKAWSTLPVQPTDSHRLMLEDFVDAVLAGGPVPAGAPDAAAGLAVVQGIYRSAAEGRSVDLS